MARAKRTLPVLTLAQARALDAHAAKKFRIATRLLMENAGAQCAQAVLRAWQAGAPARKSAVLVFCGSGGNGGDGYVIARHVLVAGVPVQVRSFGTPKPGTDAADARASWLALSKASAHSKPAAHAPTLIVVDAVLGTGVTRPVSGKALEAVAAINELRTQGARVFAVDLPSGIDTDTGLPHGTAVRAHVTLAIAATKQGLVRSASKPYRGQVLVVPFGAPATHLGARLRR